MASAQVIDSASRAAQLDVFFAQQSCEKRIAAQAYAVKAKQDVLQDAKRDPGKVISHVEFSAKLKVMNPSLMIEQSIAYPEQGGIYVRSDGANADDLNPKYHNMRFVTGMAWGMVPENTVIDVQEDDKGETRPRVVRKGWRDTLKVLIQMRLVTLAAVEKVFGAGGKNWHQQLH